MAALTFGNVHGVYKPGNVKLKPELLGEIHGEGPFRRIGDSEIVYNFGSRVGLTKHTTLLLSAGRSIRRGFDPKFIAYMGLQVNF